MQLQRLGIDIRKIGSTKNLMSDVDLILKSNGMERRTVDPFLALDAIRHALHQMMKPDNFFSVCVMDKAIAVLKIHITSERMNIYRSVHCVHWNNMLESFRTTLIAMILDDLRILFE